MSKINNYLGLCRKANYLIIGSDNLKEYHKKLFLIMVYGDLSKNLQKVIHDKILEYDIPCIKVKNEFGVSIGIENCKIIGIKNKGMSEEILKLKDEFEIIK